MKQNQNKIYQLFVWCKFMEFVSLEMSRIENNNLRNRFR